MPALTSLLAWSFATTALISAAPTTDLSLSARQTHDPTSNPARPPAIGHRTGEDAKVSLCHYYDDKCASDEQCVDVTYSEWLGSTPIKSYKIKGHELCDAESIVGFNDYEERQSVFSAKDQKVTDGECKVVASSANTVSADNVTYIGLTWD